MLMRRYVEIQTGDKHDSLSTISFGMHECTIGAVKFDLRVGFGSGQQREFRGHNLGHGRDEIFLKLPMGFRIPRKVPLKPEQFGEQSLANGLPTHAGPLRISQ